ncbi:MAG: hypothetical protein WKF76_00685 [Nocardioidaceae bacterium]
MRAAMTLGSSAKSSHAFVPVVTVRSTGSLALTTVTVSSGTKFSSLDEQRPGTGGLARRS